MFIVVIFHAGREPHNEKTPIVDLLTINFRV